MDQAADVAVRGQNPTSQVGSCTRKQEGVITLEQARAGGLSDRQVEGKVHRGEWRRPYRGVLIDNGVPVTPLQPVVAAYFAVGGPASHRLGLWIWAMTTLKAPQALEFSVPSERHVRVPGVKVYRLRAMPPVFFKGVIAVTSPMRALLDTAGVAPEVVPDAMITGFSRKLFTPHALQAEIARASTCGKPGITALRAALKELGVGRYTPSQLERRARRLFRALGLPDPQVEVKFGDHGEYRIDFYWPEADLMIEVDGWSIHATPLARRRDFRKQNRIVIGGHWILRYDWVDIVEDAEDAGAEIIEAYAARTALPLG
jgi:very-short-patch-repair endonuclease